MRIESPREEREEDGKPAMRQRRRWSAWPLAALIAMSAGGCVPSDVKSVEDDHSTYYRLKVNLAYKGEKQNFDIVVGCNVRRIYYKGNGSTYEPGLIPVLFGRRMSDGKGLVVRPPNACDGETTANGQVQPDLLPIVVVYENADALDFGTAYLSEDAYESPLSVLTFGGATIEKATKTEFDDFRRSQSNLVKRESLYKFAGGDDLLKKMNLPLVAKPLALVCETYERFRVPDGLRPLVRQHWPEGHPDYWQEDTFEHERELTHAIAPGTGTHVGSVPEHEADYGMPTRSGGGLVSAVRGGRFPAEYYPATSDYRADAWPADRSLWPEYIAAHDVFADIVVDFRSGQTKGFGYCSVPVGPDVPSKRRRIGRVDREYVFAKNGARPKGSPGSEVPSWLFERDEYVLRYFFISLGSPRGDV
jgi:hypothetical protein